MARFPKRTSSAAKGETGVNLVSLAVNDDLKWIFRRTHNEHDFGIDGYIDVVEDGGAVTGRTISVQIKCGSSFFEEGDEYGILFRGEQSQLNYILNHPTPTIIILCDPASKICYWEQVTPEITQGTGKGWKMTIPRAQTLDADNRKKLHHIAGVATDVVKDLETYWASNKIISEAGAIVYTIDRLDIERSNTSEIADFFERLQVTRDFSVSNQNKIILHVWGYDDDPRELWEVSEVRRWFTLAEPLVKYWFYFLKNGSETPSSLKLVMACVCRVNRKEEKFGRIDLECNTDDLRSFIGRNFVWLNEITDELGLTLEDNKRLSFAAMDALGLPSG